MKTDLDLAERQFLEQLHRLGSGTIQEIGEVIGVTATAVRQRLTRLQGLGLVKRELERTGRGRPHHKYQVTLAGIRSLGDNYDDLAQILWQEFQKISDSNVRRELRNRIRDAMVARFGSVTRNGPLAERFEKLRRELAGRGFSVDVDSRDGLPVLRENSCPYSELAGDDREICELEQEVFEKVLGVPVRLTQCCQDDHRCCEFELGEQDSDSLTRLNPSVGLVE